MMDHIWSSLVRECTLYGHRSNV